MKRRFPFCITLLGLSHLFLALPLLTSQLLPPLPVEMGTAPQAPPISDKTASATQSTPPSQLLLSPDLGEPMTITAKSQEQSGKVITLKGDVVIEFRDVTFKADEAVYDRESGEITGTGHMMIDGGPNDEHIEASHGTFNARTQTGKLYNVIGTTGARPTGRGVTLTTTSPFTFTGKVVEKTGRRHYILHDGTVTSCSLPTPKWTFHASRIDIDLDGNAKIYGPTFHLKDTPVFFLPYVQHPADPVGRSSGFLLPIIGQSSTKGTILGDSFYWAIDRTMDLTAGAEYFSDRGWAETLEFRAKPGENANIRLHFFGVEDRGVGTPRVDEGGQDVRLNMDGILPHDVRGVVDLEYLSSYLFRQAFAETYSEAVNSETKSIAFLTKAIHGNFLNLMGGRYQNFQSTTPGDLITIVHVPSIEVLTADHQIADSPFYWSFNGALEGVSRREPSFKTHDLVGRFDIQPRLSLPLFLRGWTLRPEVQLRDTYYTQEKTAGPGEGTPVNNPLNRRAIEAFFEIRPPTLGKIFDKPVFGHKLKHTIEPRLIYHIVNGVSGFQNVIRFDTRDILSNTNEIEYGVIQRFYFKPLKDPCANKLPTDPCDNTPRENITWELDQVYYFDPYFGGAVIPGKRNVLSTTEDFSGIAFLTSARRFSPIQSKVNMGLTTKLEMHWELDYDTVQGQINSSNLFMQYKFGDFFAGGGQTFLRVPGEIFTSNPIPGPTEFNQFRLLAGYGGPAHRGYSAAASMGFDSNVNFLQFISAQHSYNWDCCGLSMEYRHYALGTVRNENMFRFAFTLANIGSFGNMKRQEKLY